MDESRWTPKAVILAAILHLGIVGFLFLAVLPCSTYESLFAAIGLPASWNPISCEKPIQLAGEVIDATLVGVTGSPPPKSAQTKPVPHTVPPPSTPPPPPPPVQQPPPKPSPLPPPPEHPDAKDQEHVVEEAAEKAEEAKQLQDEKERQRQSQIDAKAAAMKKADDILRQMDNAHANTSRAASKADQAKAQLADLKNASDNAQANLPKADQLQSGQNGPDAGLQAQYIAAIQNAVTPNWVHPDNMPNVSCKVNIVQSPGGDVLTANVDSSCSYDEASKRSIENAVLRTKTLPYKGFESVFNRNLTLTFKP